MANQRPKAVFFILLLLSAHAHRIDLTSSSKIQIGSGLNSTAVQPIYQTYSSFQLAHRSTTVYRQSFTSTLVRSNGYEYYTRTSISSMSEFCGSGLYTDMKMIPQPLANGGFDVPAITASVEPMWPLLIAAGVVMMGGLYLYHRHRMNGPVEASFCPVSSWEADPVGNLVPDVAVDAFGEEFASLMSAENHHNNRGMPHCHGLRRHRLRADCDGDVDCKRQACRQMCCDRRDCTFFQFNNIDRTDYCWLGSRSRLSTGTCEEPYFGETCTTCLSRRMVLWPQIQEDNMKCHSSLFGHTGFVVRDQHECQAHALEQGHEFYQFDSSRNMCESEASCDSPSRHSTHSWQIFSSRDMPSPSEAAVRPSPDQEEWQFAPFLFHQHGEGEMQTVTLSSSERCGEGDVTCMRDACRAKCLEHEWCIHYQFESGGHACHLGATHIIDEDNVGMWFGGILTQNRLCSADEFKCPSSHECVSACGGQCAGHSRDGPDGWCVRSAIENIVDFDGWTDTYRQSPISAWCRGIERTVVTVSQGLRPGQSGADICRAACSADSQCALWQMYPSDAENTDLSEGDHVRCWLGFEDQMGNPRFSCTGRSPKRWRLLTAPQAQAVLRRGCHEEKVACVISQMCVENCYDECPGFEITGAEIGICEPSQNPSFMSEGVPMDLALAHNLPGVTENPEDAMLADEEDLFTMSLNLQNVINPDTFNGDITALCDVLQGSGAQCELVDGACVCEYEDDVDCLALFGQERRLIPVMATEGMMMLSHDGCSCEGRICTLNLLSSVPPVRTSEDATSAVQLSNEEMQICEASVTCPNMNTCEPIQYGLHGCGYACENDNGRYWCSHRCACNQEEAVAECTVGTMCPEMDSCDPISYGEYGCGYGCMKGSVFHFCNDACTVCNL